MELRGKKALVVGLGISGRAAVRFLADRGAQVWATDRAEASALAPDLAELTPLIARLTLGGHRDEDFVGADLIVVSPGVPLDIAPLAAARSAGVEIVGELGLAAGFIEAPLVAVTGTNGKTTVVQIIGRMFQEAGRETFVGGNIGAPLIGLAAEGRAVDVAVCEVSSFQIDTAPDLHPRVAVLTNITPDHLDRYPDLEAYAASKLRLFAHQGPGDVAVLNAGDARIVDASAGIPAEKWWFGPRQSGGQGVFVDGRDLVVFQGDREIERFSLDRWSPPGTHNLENLMAALLAARALDVGAEAVRRVIGTFALEAHRMETVGVKDGVTFVNDSKATNVDAVRRAVESYSSPIVLLLGGRDKGGDWPTLIRVLPGRVRSLVLFGEAGADLARAMNGFVWAEAADLDEAVRTASRQAQPGDVVLLSPGCASFDQYGSYAERGDHFRRLVEELA